MAMVLWTKMDERTYAAEIVADDGARYRLTLERLSARDWDWTVWRQSQPPLCDYGVALGGPKPGFAAAEQAVRSLMQKSGQPVAERGAPSLQGCRAAQDDALGR